MRSYVLLSGFLGLLSGAVSFAGQLRATQPDAIKGAQPSAGALPLSTAFVSRSSFKGAPPQFLQWEGRTYDVDTAVGLLVRIVKDRTTCSEKRALALDRLGAAGLHLHGQKSLDEIVELYGAVATGAEKRGILSCLVASDDPRGLPLLYEALDKESNPILRLLAANGLARWNIRRGVQELIELVACDIKLGDRQLGGEAAGAFHVLNQAKAWGCPDEEILQAAASGSGVEWDQYVRALVRGLREWFDQNKERFPDWKLGDPLPEVQREEEKGAGEE